MRLEVVTDEDLIKSIMFNPDIWEAVAEDDFTQDRFKAPKEGELWLGVFIK